MLVQLFKVLLIKVLLKGRTSVAGYSLVGCLVLTAVAMTQGDPAYGQWAGARIYCDEPGVIVSTDSGVSGRSYPCYSLHRLRGVKIPGTNHDLICDLEGPITATRTGTSGRRYDCYILNAKINVRVRNSHLVCEQELGSVTSITGFSGRRFGCYALKTPLVIEHS